MKKFNTGLCAIVAALIVFGSAVVDSSPLNQNRQLGAAKCTWGPSYWCSNITNAKGCHAVRHCIQTVWETHQVPVDNDSICQICKDMVTQARDQLRSNETMEELKEVFEGSCNLIPIKIVRKECCKLADDFIPELIETLSSQMNPDQVCSVAGLCNNAEIDKLLMKYYTSALDGSLKEEDDASAELIVPTETNDLSAAAAPKQLLLSCGNCYNVAKLMTDKFQSSNRDDVLENILHICGEMSSFSDACANIALTYFNQIYDHIKENLQPAGVCHISGVCAAKYHQHPEDPKEEQAIDLMAPGNDDIPCQLCEQLVRHLRDVLIANTTESEFKQVMEGLCNQTKGFRTECLSIVDQYYDVIYQTLVNNLDANGACFLIGVCPKGLDTLFHGEIRPLLPVLPPAEIKVTIRKKLGAHEPKFSQNELKAMTLPIDHLMGAANPGLLVEGGELCTVCEYLLHFIQESLATPATEEEIKHLVNGICDKFPNSIRSQCHNFIDMYGDAVIALLVQGLDPRQVCPKMQMCPPNHENHNDMEVFQLIPVDEQDKPTCPLCLFAVEQAQEKIKNDKSKKNIENVLNHLCSHLPSKLQNECVDFVQTYSSELIDMLITDFKPQEICVALKLCPKSKNYLDDLGISLENENNSDDEEDFALNEINDSEELPVEIVFQQHNEGSSPNCLLCIEMVKLAEKRLDKHMTKDDIKKALEHSCLKLRKNLQPKCHQYVDKYGDIIAELLLKEMDPKLICAEIGLCLFSEQEDLEIDEALKYDVIAMPNENSIWINKNDRFVGMDEAMTMQEPPTCVLCEFIMTKLEMELKNKTEQDEIKQAIKNICNIMPKTVSKSCDKFVEQYANAIIALVGTIPPKEICQKMQLCFAGLSEVITDEVIECGVCHGASMTLLPYLRKHTEHNNIGPVEMINVACENLPAKYYQICSEMVRIYGKSIMNLSERIALDETHICAEIGKCFDNEKSNLAFARISDTLLIIKCDYLAKRKHLLLHLLERGFLLKGQRKICFSPELAAEFFQDMSEDRCFMYQVILLSKGYSEAFILCKENAVEDLLNTMVCYFGTSIEMEQNIHVTKCYNKVHKEISFIFPNYIYEPIECPEQLKFCMNNPLVESTFGQLYDMITKPETDPHKTWKQKLAEFLLLSNKNLPRISNQCSYNTNLMAQEIAQQTKISCMVRKAEEHPFLSDLDLSSPPGTSVDITTSSCVSCSPFSSGAECIQQWYQQKAYEEVIKARTAPLEVPVSSSSSKIDIAGDALEEHKAEEIIGEEEETALLEKEAVDKIEIKVVDSTEAIVPSPPAEDVDDNETGSKDASDNVVDDGARTDQADENGESQSKEENVETQEPVANEEPAQNEAPAPEVEGNNEPEKNADDIAEEVPAE